MSDVIANPPKSSNFQAQANCLDRILLRCSMIDGNTAQSSYLEISKDDVAELKAIAARLWRMSPHEDQIKNLVLKYDG